MGGRRVARDEAWAAVFADKKLAEPRFVEYGDGCVGALFGDRGNNKKRGVVLFHTAAGPRDLFLHWKASLLAAQGCAVLVADLYGDPWGQAWDPAWPGRTLTASETRRRAVAAADYLRNATGVERFAAMGWCLGGRAAIELFKAGESSRLAAVASFHGVLDADSPMLPARRRAKILVLHGDKDPFVPQLDAFRAQMREFGASVDVHAFGDASHGFTNPAQRLNEKDGFDYDERAAKIAWRLAEAHLAEAGILVLPPSP
ncbi:hypothetical protein CTAYLR_001166 [Chrysophaeum taylorii]|uniref:Dienelactone hydrolase domain-containing protein n=1 Tax=Chrysophaeum taylorii TaxID=2483200 RepID=A0AAD7UP34_9STRA|nr:hypothetical protein CTAYLR_001166 [Chrysophaeum taylorii]